jgi:hypothetical protein
LVGIEKQHLRGALAENRVIINGNAVNAHQDVDELEVQVGNLFQGLGPISPDFFFAS